MRRVGDKDHLYTVKPVRMAMPELKEDEKDTVAKTRSTKDGAPKATPEKTSDPRVQAIEGIISKLWMDLSSGLDRIVLNSAEDVDIIDSSDVTLVLVPSETSDDVIEEFKTEVRNRNLVCFQFNQRGGKGYRSFKDKFDSEWFRKPTPDKDVKSMIVVMDKATWKENRPDA